MGGDLNLKKSWHPSLMSNQKRVWEEEKRALDERKKIDQIRKEREEERQLQELQDLQESAGGKKRQARVDWMYAGPAHGQSGTSEENEAYLLGKRRVDTLLQGKEKETLQKSAGQESFMAAQNANTLRDTAAKIRDDPLLAIKKQEQAAYEAMMNDPVKRRMLLKAAGHDESSERDHKRRKHRHHRSDRDERDRYSRRRSRYDSEDRHHRSRRNRDLSRSPSHSGSPSPPRRSKRSESPRRRSYTPENVKTRPGSRSPYRSYDGGDRVRKAKSWHSSNRGARQKSRTPPRRSPSADGASDAAARLAAMQQDASELETQRQNRLDEIAKRERADIEKDQAYRARNAKWGGKADFVNGFQKRAGDLSLGDRAIRNGRRREDGED